MTKIRTKTLGGSYEYDTSKAAVMLELCNYEGLCCQTSSLDNPGEEDRDKYYKEDVYTDEAILGNCTKKVGRLEKLRFCHQGWLHGPPAIANLTITGPHAGDGGFSFII